MMTPDDHQEGLAGRLRHEARGLALAVLFALVAGLLLLGGAVLALTGGYVWLNSFMEAYQAAFLLALVLFIAGAIVIACLLAPRRPPPASATRNAAAGSPDIQAALGTAIGRNPLPTLAAALAAGAVYGLMKDSR